MKNKRTIFKETFKYTDDFCRRKKFADRRKLRKEKAKRKYTGRVK